MGYVKHKSRVTSSEIKYLRILQRENTRKGRSRNENIRGSLKIGSIAKTTEKRNSKGLGS